MTVEQWQKLQIEGDNHMRAGRCQEALATYEQALRLNPGSSYLHRVKGTALYMLGHSEEALAAFEQALRISPTNVDYHFKGRSLFSLGRYQEAVIAYEQAIQLDPKDAGSYERKGYALSMLGRPEEAVRAINQADQLDPSQNRLEEFVRLFKKRVGEAPSRYWVMRREASDAGPGGYYRRMKKYSGPFATKSETWAKAQELNDEQRRSISDERLDKGTRRALFEVGVNYWPMSEDEMEEARRNRTRIY